MRARCGQGSIPAPLSWFHKLFHSPSTLHYPPVLSWTQVDYLGSQLLKHFDIPFDGEAAEAPEDDELVLARMKARLETESEDDDAEVDDDAEEKAPPAED